MVFNKAGALSPVPCIDVRLPKPSAAEEESKQLVHAEQTATSAAARAADGETGGPEAQVAGGGEAVVGSAAAAISAAVSASAGPDDVDACRAEVGNRALCTERQLKLIPVCQGALVCRGDTLVGVQGGGMDELTGLMLKVRRCAAGLSLVFRFSFHAQRRTWSRARRSGNCRPG